MADPVNLLSRHGESISPCRFFAEKICWFIRGVMKLTGLKPGDFLPLERNFSEAAPPSLRSDTFQFILRIHLRTSEYLAFLLAKV